MRRQLVLIAAVLSGGCQGRQEYPRFLLDEHFTGYQMQGAHMTYATATDPKPDEDTALLRRKLIGYLSGQDARVYTEFPDRFQNLTPPLRARDFWALALARLSGKPLTILMTDTEAAREAKITALLKELTGGAATRQ
jgi:hypothetical protein